MARQQLERLKNPLTGEVRLVAAYSKQFNELRRYGWLRASLMEWLDYINPKRRTASDRSDTLV